MTNYRIPHHLSVTTSENPPSRGELVISWVKGEISKEEFTTEVFENLNEYKGFNFVYGVIDEEEKNSYMYHISNHNPGKQSKFGIYL